MDSNSPTAEDVLRFQIDRSVRNLFKQFLVILEDLQQEHDENFNKLKRAMPENEALINQADYFSDNKSDYLRKKILDIGNDCLREVQSNIKYYDVNLKVSVINNKE